MNALVYVVLALAAYRIARVPTKDSISLAWRERLYAWAWDDENAEVQHTADGDVFVPKSRGSVRSYVYELLTCPLCLGVWVAAAVYSAWRWWDTDAVHAVIAIFAVAGLQCFLALKEGD